MALLQLSEIPARLGNANALLAQGTTLKAGSATNPALVEEADAALLACYGLLTLAAQSVAAQMTVPPTDGGDQGGDGGDGGNTDPNQNGGTATTNRIDLTFTFNGAATVPVDKVFAYTSAGGVEVSKAWNGSGTTVLHLDTGSLTYQDGDDITITYGIKKSGVDAGGTPFFTTAAAVAKPSGVVALVATLAADGMTSSVEAG